MASPPAAALTPLVLDHAVAALPSVSYIPDFVTPEDEQRLLRECQASRARWTQLSGRRLQNYGGVVHAKGLIPAAIPTWLVSVLSKLTAATGVYGDGAPNHVLVNSYHPGEGIMPHEDGPSYHPGVCILSLAAPAVIRLRRKQAEGVISTTPDVSLVLQPRSLLVFWGEAYTDFLHGIDSVSQEEVDMTVANASAAGVQHGDVLERGGERISLTVRWVPKVLKGLKV